MRRSRSFVVVSGVLVLRSALRFRVCLICGVGRGFVVQLFVGAVYPPALHVHAFWRSFGGRCTTPVVVGLVCGYRVAGRWLAPRVWRGRIAVVRWHCLSEVQVRVLFALLSSRSVGGRLLCGVALV